METTQKKELKKIAESLTTIASQSSLDLNTLKILNLKLGEIINSLNTTKIEVNGIPITTEKKAPSNAYLKIINRHEVPSISDVTISNRLLAPIAQSYINTNEKYEVENIHVEAIIFIKQKLNVKTSEIKLKYNIGFNNSGQEQLNIYVSFESSEPKEPTLDDESLYYFYYLNIYFEGKEIIGKSDTNIYQVPSENIKTVQLFLIKEDPRTSRGTVTTVQTHNSDSSTSPASPNHLSLSVFESIFKQMKQ
ncbi:hypothetical protein [Kordia sp.]|uniref:hypothetical protein n=1 Tax=Kordia sp. TaxID=1965332 RepID=UPI003D6A5B7D